MPWEEFRGKRQLFSTREPRLTIQARGNIGLNAPAFKALGSPERVVFLYDRARRALAIRAALGTDKHSYPVKRQLQSDSYVLSAKAFLTYVDMALGTLHTYYPHIEDGMLVVELSEANDDGQKH